MFGKFMARAALLPVSRELYEEYARTWPGIHDPLEQAVRWYYIARQSFGGMFGKSSTEFRRHVREELRNGRQFDELRNVLANCPVDQQL